MLSHLSLYHSPDAKCSSCTSECRFMHFYLWLHCIISNLLLHYVLISTLCQVIRALISSHPVPKRYVLRGFGATAKQDQATTASFGSHYRLLPIRRLGFGVPYDSKHFLISEKDKKITTGTNHMTTFSLQTLHSRRKKT